MRRIIVPIVHLVVALLLPMSLTAQQPANASNPAGEQLLRDLVRVMNANDRASLRRFVDEHFVNQGEGAVPPEQRVERLNRLRSNFGELALRGVEATKPGEVTALAQSGRTEAWSRMTVYLAGSPARIT